MKKRQFVPIHFDAEHRLAVLSQMSSQAKKYFKDTLPEGKKLKISLEMDRNKLEELNRYIRKCTPENIRSSMHYQDDGDSISMIVPNRIFVGVKPDKKSL